MRFRSFVLIGFLGVFVLTAVGCAGSAPSQPPADLPAAGAGGSAAGLSRAAQRLGGVRRNVSGCSGSGTDSFVGGMSFNVAAGINSGVLSGSSNDACDQDSGIGVGFGNTINSSLKAHGEFIGAGDFNTISGGTDAFIGGGANNKVSAQDASVLGGSHNTAGGTESTVAGGGENIAAGFASFAAGLHADAAQGGSFVWSDSSSSTTTKATVANEFVARTAGGVKFFSNSAMTTGVSLAPGGGSWGSVSDRAVKTDVREINDSDVLDKVAAMPITQWSYISERGVRHVGPMAQDFYAAFGVGEDNKHITSIDEDGVALAAIKALHAQVAQTQAVVADLQKRLAQKDASLHALRGRMSAGETRLTRLETKLAALR